MQLLCIQKRRGGSKVSELQYLAVDSFSGETSESLLDSFCQDLSNYSVKDLKHYLAVHDPVWNGHRNMTLDVYSTLLQV